jgi:hypothetical protein
MRKIHQDEQITMEDVAVVLVGYNRPRLLKNRLLEISNTRISHLYIFIDGGSDLHKDEFILVKNYAKKLFPSKVLNIEHSEINLGISTHVTSVISKVLQKHDYIIFIEDDVMLSSNFLVNVLFGLNLQKQLNLTGIVSGYSHRFNKKFFRNKWHEEKIPYFWGWGCSAKTWEGYELDLRNAKFEEELTSSTSWEKLKIWEKRYLLKNFNRVKQNPSLSWDPQFIFHLLKYNHVNIAPIFSLTGNEGFGDESATHTKYEIPSYINNHKLNNQIVTRFSQCAYLHEVLNTHIIKHELKMYLVRLRNKIFGINKLFT